MLYLFIEPNIEMNFMYLDPNSKAQLDDDVFFQYYCLLVLEVFFT